MVIRYSLLFQKFKFMVREEQMNHPWAALFCRVALAQHEVFTQTLSAHRACLSTHAHTCSLMQTINNAHTQKRNFMHRSLTSRSWCKYTREYVEQERL